MKKEENSNKNKLEKSLKNDMDKSPDNENKLSDERLKKKYEADSTKNSKPGNKKQKKKFSKKKRKSIEMYLVFFIFLMITIICILIHHFALIPKTAETFDKNKKVALAGFIILLIASFILSIIVSCCECLIKTYFLGSIFFIILNFSIDYCSVYISYLNYFEPLFCFLIILASGSFGCFFLTLLVKDDFPNIIILLLINLLFSLIGGLILFFIYKTLWDRLFSIFGLIISEFNVYSSQFKLCSKDKKAPLTFSQPFELIISFFKMIFFLFNIIIKVFKFFARICKCKDKEEKEEVEKNNENIAAEDIEAGGENIEPNAVRDVQIVQGGKENITNSKKK